MYDHTSKQKGVLDKKDKALTDKDKAIGEKDETIKNLSNLNKKLNEENKNLLGVNKTHKNDIKKMQKDLDSIKEQYERMSRSQDQTMEANSQILQTGAQNQAEANRLKKRFEKCDDDSCFNEKYCKKNHDHKKQTRKVCRHFNRKPYGCKFGDSCHDLHIQKQPKIQEIPMEVDMAGAEESQKTPHSRRDDRCDSGSSYSSSRRDEREGNNRGRSSGSHYNRRRGSSSRFSRYSDDKTPRDQVTPVSNVSSRDPRLSRGSSRTPTPSHTPSSSAPRPSYTPAPASGNHVTPSSSATRSYHTPNSNSTNTPMSSNVNDPGRISGDTSAFQFPDPVPLLQPVPALSEDEGREVDRINLINRRNTLLSGGSDNSPSSLVARDPPVFGGYRASELHRVNGVLQPIPGLGQRRNQTLSSAGSTPPLVITEVRGNYQSPHSCEGEVIPCVDLVDAMARSDVQEVFIQEGPVRGVRSLAHPGPQSNPGLIQPSAQEIHRSVLRQRVRDQQELMSDPRHAQISQLRQVAANVDIANPQLTEREMLRRQEMEMNFDVQRFNMIQNQISNIDARLLNNQQQQTGSFQDQYMSSVNQDRNLNRGRYQGN